MLNFAIPFLKASITCGIAAVVILALLSLAMRIWPVLAGHRSVWLCAQAAIAAAFVLALLPHSAGYSVLPAIEIARPAAAAGAVTPPPMAQFTASEADGPEDEGIDPVELIAQAWLALYAAGLLAAAARWIHAQRALRALLVSAHPLDAAALAQHAGFSAEPVRALLQRGLRVSETEVAISPMLAGLAQPHLLLPQHLRGFSEEQQRLIIAHELTHWQRRDPAWLHAGMLLQTVFWFNPLLAVLTRRLAWAQELGCDRAVLAGRPHQQRQQYAAALVAQLKVQQAGFDAPAASIAFGHAGQASLSARVGLIREHGLRALGLPGKAAVAAGLGAVLAASIFLQPAFAWRSVEAPLASAAPASASASVSAPAQAPVAVSASAGTPQWRMPLDWVRVTSFYGAARKNLKDGHHGIDFAARTGTPVLATADGTVITSTARFEGGTQYGDVVMIEHANGLRSLYAHLSARSVRPGEVVWAGQTIGLAGETGKVTGPHLHLEVFKDGWRVDPQRFFKGLDAQATSKALRMRPPAQAL